MLSIFASIFIRDIYLYFCFFVDVVYDVDGFSNIVPSLHPCNKSSFIMLRYLPSKPILLSFYHEWMLNFVECFFSVYGDDYVVFVLFVDVVDDVDGFSSVVPSLHPWNKFYLIMMDDLFYVFFNLVC